MGRLFDDPTAMLLASGVFLLLLAVVATLLFLMFRSSRRAALNERARQERHDAGLDHPVDRPASR